MAASDNVDSAAAALRRLASGDEATLRAALSYMGRTPFQRLRRAVGCTETPEPSGDEGGSGPAGAASSSPYRLDPVNVTNQVTAPAGANLNNLDPATDAYSFAGRGAYAPLRPRGLGRLRTPRRYRRYPPQKAAQASLHCVCNAHVRHVC